MHYQELHGDMPIHALQAFGGYLAMGDTLGWDISQKAKNGQISFRAALDQFVKENDPSKVASTDTRAVASYVDGLLNLASVAKESGKISQESFDKFKAFQVANPTNLQAQINELKKMFGMSTMSKVLIGLGIAGVVAGGYYMYHKKD